jgi:DNA-binding PadR family transcriptional regulator
MALGEFEQLVLLAVLRLDDAAYGASIRQVIEEMTGRRAGIGAIYTTLERLHAKGMLRWRVSEPMAERGGRRRKLYRLQPAGRRALAGAWQSWVGMTRGLESKLEAL